jgi:CPA1 family monovalent cation:H+ antiporter
MVLSLLFSVLLLIGGAISPEVGKQAKELIGEVNFSETLLEGMLGFLLFAGALHVNLNDLRSHKWGIASLAFAGTLISTFLIALISWFAFNLVGLPMNFLYCLLLGAIISPTDPIAVLAILKQSAAPAPVRTMITGESLFNDGVAVVLFVSLTELTTSEHGFEWSHFLSIFAQEVVGGMIFGLVLGLIAFQLVRSIDDYPVEILVTFAVSALGYALAHRLHLSGPIAMVVAGLVLGNHGRNFGMSAKTNERLDQFWELIDEFLNAVLFVLIGLELLILNFTKTALIAGLLMIPVVLFARFIAVSIPIGIIRQRIAYPKFTIRILTWGGLRGGISVALALALPKLASVSADLDARELILAITYIVVVFSILVQGLTIGLLVRQATGNAPVPTSSH